MQKYVIGLIEDEESELKKIRRTIKTNFQKPEITYDFISYPIPDNPIDVIDNVFNNVFNDIESEKIMSLIIDYKIMVKRTTIKGTEILKQLKERVSQFPVIILTEMVSESIKPLFVDSDKVYEKNLFFKLEEEYSKKKVENIFDSMYKYVKQKDEMTVELNRLKENLSNENTDRNTIKSIIEIEKKLDNFIPTNLTTFDLIFDNNKAKKIIDLIDEVKKLVE